MKWAVAFIGLFLCVLSVGKTFAQQPAAPDSSRRDTLRYPLQDRRTDAYSQPDRNPFDLSDTSFINRSVEYDPVTKQYFIVEKIGDRYYRTPTTFSQQEFLRLQGQEQERNYFRKRADLLSELNRRQFKPQFGFNPDWMNRVTGNGKVDIRPSGYLTITTGYRGQNVKNPALPERARKNGNFDFDMNAQLQVDASIGDKIKLPINYSSQTTFDFENQLKLDYQGKPDEILKQFQAGNVNFPSKGTLIPGAQSLFGIKTQLQFGKLFVTTVLANQRSQRQSLGVQGGASSEPFSLKADEYDENRHFLMAQYFRSHYNEALANLPLVQSNVQILRVEVWVTNKTGTPDNTRDVVALADLGEGGNTTLPNNNANNLLSQILANPNSRNTTQIQSILTGLGLRPVTDFEKTFARKLDSTSYRVNRQLGYISLNTQLQTDEVLGIAFQYTYNGKVYQVGEFSQDVPPDSTANTQKVLFLKLLKATSQRPTLPIWDLMMKNVYSVGYGQLQRDDFKLDILYEQPSLGQKRYMPIDENGAYPLDPYKGLPILNLVNLDRLNSQNDPQPDGVFDYIEGITVLSDQSRIIFPVLEPFGRDLEYIYATQEQRDQFIFYPLYDTIKEIAKTFANLDRFTITGRSKSSSTTDYQLGFNIPQGSVTVTAGGQVLQENVDYEINYSAGTLRIVNQAIINSGVPVDIQYENGATFGLQNKNYMGLRLDYLANRNLTLGGTVVRLGERPYFTKQSYGDDPIRNTMVGFDVDYQNEVPRLSKWLNKLPFYSTTQNSSIAAYGEAAWLIPGHAPQIGKGNSGVIFLDDFEGTRSSIDLRFPIINWALASTPKGDGLFPEADNSNDLSYGFNRAKIAWYNIEPVLQERRNPNNPIKDLDELSKPETRQVYQQEIFPQRSVTQGQTLVNTFNLTFYPNQKGPYNYESRGSRIDANNRLRNPREAWGGLMRSIDQPDFESANIEYIEFWLQDPFILNSSSSGGKLFFNLGNISEDIEKDGKRQFENGLPTPTNNARVDNSTVWGQVPINPIQVTDAFSNDPNDRQYQDVGLDGLTDEEERTKYAAYLAQLGAVVGTGSPAYQAALADPSADNFRNYRDQLYDQQNAGILARYKDINNPHGNSPVADPNATQTTAFTLYPDQEDLNKDNTLNETEEYFEYEVNLQPNMPVGNNFITDRRTVDVKLANGNSRTETWYLFRIPIAEYTQKVGDIPDFKSIRFIRMFMTGFEDSVTLRFGKLELVRNQWRQFSYELDTTGNYKPLPQNDPTEVNTIAVNLEENDQRQPIPYRIPPGVERQQALANNNVPVFINEQSLSLQTCNLEPKQARGVFKTISYDLRQYGKLSMFIHLEAQRDDNLADGAIDGVVRIGTDFVSNYYEIRIPLKVTPWFSQDSLSIWPELNNLDFSLNELTRLKARRNSNGVSPAQYYQEEIDGRQYAVIGNPNLGEVRGILLGVQNNMNQNACIETWFNELRLSQLDEKGGYAALGRVDINLADLGGISLSGLHKSNGFGTLEQKVNERSREDLTQVDAAINLDMGKLLPKQAAIQIPVYASISQTTSTPEYDPYDLDIKLRDKLDANPGSQDSIRQDAVDQTTIKTLTFTNVKKIRTSQKAPMPWDISNIDLNYSYSSQKHHNPIIEEEELKRTRAAVGYNYAPREKFIEPFSGLIKSKSPWLGLVRDFNFNYAPAILSFKADVLRQFGAYRARNVGGPKGVIPETYNKYFTFDRYYSLRWNLTRSLSLDFNAINNARIDEPAGRIDTKEKRDSVKSNLFDGGRNTRYHHDVAISYQLPTQSIPLLDWTTVRASYSANYDWIGASLLPSVKRLGNTITNGQTKDANATLSFEQLYGKSKWLRAILADNKPEPTGEAKRIQILRDSTDTTNLKRKWVRNPKWQPAPNGLTRFLGGMVLGLKTLSFQYNETSGTELPGYLDSTQALGMNWRSGAPSFPFVFGYQPDTSWINRIGARGLLTHDSLFNSLIQQRYNQTITVNAQISPVRDLVIDLSLQKTYDKQYSELYKDTSTVDNVGLTRLNPYIAGSFRVSYLSYQTLFNKFDPNTVSETFKQFEANRAVLSQRLADQNPYASKVLDPNDPAFYQGYGRYAQEVLVPAFVAAYTKKDPLTIGLLKNDNPSLRSNPFARYKPKPNWNITYNGLSRIDGMEKIFTNFTLRHGYTSSLGMNSFNSALLFQDPFGFGYPSFVDPNTGNYIPYFLVPNITISESFAPLLGVSMTFTNQLDLSFEYAKTRNLSLSLIDYQLSESRTSDINVNARWRTRNLPILRNVKIGKKGMKLDNDVTFALAFTLSDNATANAKLDQEQSFGTAGQKRVNISPSIDYVVNSRVSLKFYFKQERIIPKIATTAPVTNTQGGLQITISLAQ